MKWLSSNAGASRWLGPRRFVALLGSALLVFVVACGSDSKSSNTPTQPSTVVQVNMGDDPADWMLAFSMKATSMSLVGAGTTLTYSDTPMQVEMIHRLGIMEPVALVAATPGTYTGATMTIASCNVTYVDPQTKQIMQKTINGPFNATVTFPTSVTVDKTPLAFNFDLDLEHSLTTDGSGNFQFSPVFHHSLGVLGNGTGTGINPRYGGMHQMMGVVSNVTSDSFTIIPVQAVNTFRFRVSNQTQYQGRVSNMAQLSVGMGVLVTAALQSDGTMLATRVRATMSSGGAMGGGIITAVTGQPATQLTVVMQNGAGASILTDYLSKTITVNLTDTTTYEIDTDRISLAGLDFTPAFDASNIYAGQSVLPFSESDLVANTSCSPSCGTITASTVRLREQGFRGTTDVAINPGTSSTFVLTLMPECAFTSLTGATQITVYQLTSTNVESQTAIAAGATLRVHGLLFKNAGHWVLIASTIASS